MADKKYDTRVFTNSNISPEPSTNQSMDLESAPATTKNTAQGEIIETSVRAENTIVAQEEDILTVQSYNNVAEIELEKSSTTEKVHNFDSILDRWVPVDKLEFKTSHKQGEILMQTQIPLGLLSKDACTPNVLPFEQFIYGKMDIDMLFKINGNKFQAGKLLVSVLPGTPGLYDGDDAYYSMYSALQRPNVILDASSNNEAILPLNWIFHRTFIRLHAQAHQNAGVAAGEYLRVIVHVLSKLNVQTDQLPSVFVTPFFKIRKANFAAMSYKKAATAQMMAGMATASNFIEGIKLAERSLRMVGDLANRDKPTDLVSLTRVVPQPRLNFSNSRGLSDAIPFRMDQTALTSFTADHKLMIYYKTTKQIMRIWGLAGTFQWKTDSIYGTELVTYRLDPTNFVNDINQAREAQLTPLEYIMSFYQFWRGTIEVRLDFVSTSFHTGSIMISAEFGRKSASLSMCESSSTYTKTFDLAEQKTVQFTIPYIYDTVWRRANNLPIIGTSKPQITTWTNRSGVLYQNFGKLKIRVVNQLRPITSVAKDIEVLVYIRAGSDFEAHSIIQNNFNIAGRCNAKLDDFPVNDYPTSYKKSGDGLMWTVEKKIKPQMNTEYLDQDTTHDFKPMQVRRIQHSEYMMDIKDLMRRPLLIMVRVSVSEYSLTDVPSAYFIPVQPITLSMLGGDNADFAPATANSAHVALTTLFRFWRGSLRYNCVFYSGTSTDGIVIYVSYIPHSGSRIIGNRKYPFAVDDNTDASIPKEVTMNRYDLGSVGVQTEMVIPSINPTCSFEIPYYTETNWTWLNNGNKDDGGNANKMPWRDKADENIGHLIVRASKDVKMDVWLSVGDDFEFAGFLGTIKGKRWNESIAKADDHPRAQVLERLGMNKKMVCDGLKALAKPISLAAVNYYNPALVLPAAVATYGSSLMDFSSSVSKLTKDLGDITTGGKVATDKLNSTLERTGTIMEVVEETIDKILKPVVGLDFSHIKLVLTDLMLDFYSCWSNWSPKAVALVICKVLLKMQIIGITSMATLTQAVQKLVSFFPFGPKAQNEGEDWRVVVSNFLGLAVAAVSAVMGVRNRSTVPVSLLNGLYVGFFSASTWSIVTHATRFFKDTICVFQRITMWLVGMESPEARGLSIMSANSSFLKVFIQDAQDFLKEANLPVLRTQSHYKIKFWITVCNAYTILAKLAESPNNKVSPVLVSLCKSIIKKSNDIHAMISCSPVRYEPFVICLEGEAGIGKSKIAKQFAYDSLKTLGYTSDGGELTYYKTSGTEFWNSYKAQPVIIFDDFMNIRSTEKIDAHVSDLYNLKSAAIFNPPMARLEEKEIRANPLTVILLMNNAFAEVGNVSCKKALTRRRDIVIKARIVEKYQSVPVKNIDIKILEKYDHLEFCTYKDANDEKSLNARWVSYAELKQYLSVRHIIYHQREQKSIQKDIKNMQEFFSKEAQKHANIGDPFTLMYSGFSHLQKLRTESDIMPSDQITQLSKQLAEKMQKEIVQQEEEGEEVILPEEPADPCTISPNILNFFSSRTKDAATSAVESRNVNLKIANSVQGFFDSLINRTSSDIKKCTICHDVKYVYAICTGHKDHIVCCSCYYMKMSYAEGTSKCALCRTGNYASYSTTGQIKHAASYLDFKVLCRILRGLPGFMAGNISLYILEAARSVVAMVQMQHSYSILFQMLGINFGLVEATTQHTFNYHLWGMFGGASYLELHTRTTAILHKLISLPALRASLALGDKLEPKQPPIHPNGPAVVDEGSSREVEEVKQILQLEDCPPSTSKFEIVHEEIPQWESTLGQTAHDDCVAGRISEHTLGMIAIGKIKEDPSKINDIMEDLNEAHYALVQRNKEKIRDSNGFLVQRSITPTHEDVVKFLNSEEAEELRAKKILDNYQQWFKDFGLPIKPIDFEREGKHKTLACDHYNLDPELVMFMKETDIGPAWSQMIDSKSPGEEFLLAPNAICERNLNCHWSVDPHKRVEFLQKWVQTSYTKDKLKETLESGENNIPEEFIWPVEESKSNIMDLYDKFLESDWWTYLSDKFKKWKKMLTMLGYGLAGVATIYVTYKGCKNMWSFFNEPGIQSQAVYNTTVPVRATGRGVKFIHRDRSQSDSSLEASCKFLYRNMGHIIAGKDGQEMWCTFVGLGGRKAIIMTHYIPILKRHLEEGSKFSLRPLGSPNLLIPWKFETLCVGEELKPDITIITMPPQYPIFKNITKYFARSNEVNEASLDVDGMMLEPPSMYGDNISVLRPIEYEKYCVSKTIEQNLPSGQRKYEIVDVIQYNYARDGACGALVMSAYLDRPILGVHVAGSGQGYRGTGYAVILTQEELQGVVFGVQDFEEINLHHPDDAKIALGSDEGIVPLGSVLPNMATFVPHTTSIIPSIIQYDLAPVYSEPCILSSRDARHNEEHRTPLVAGILKHGHLVDHLDSNILREVSDYLQEYYKKFVVRRVGKKKLTVKEALCGFKGLDYYDPIDLATSAGWPWTQIQPEGIKSKEGWLTFIRDKDQYPVEVEISNMLANRLESNEKKRQQGIVPFTVFTDLLKDERKLSTKVKKEGATRVFCASPVDCTIATRQLFLDFCAMFMANRFETMSAVGIATDGPEWAKLRSYLVEYNDNVVCLDYKNFGPAFSAQAFDVAKQVILAYLTTMDFSVEEMLEAEVLLEEHQNSNHICCDFLYKQLCGSPSGSALTVIINSLVNVVYMSYAWIEITKTSMAQFIQNVRLVTYGDDLLMAVRPEYFEQFNGKTISECLLCYKIETSDDRKEEFVAPSRHIDDATFLKCKFKPHPTRPGQYLSQLEWTSVEEAAKWVNKKDNHEAATIENAEASVRMAFGHGREKFNQWKKKVNAALKKNHIRESITVTWDECDRNFFETPMTYGQYIF